MKDYGVESISQGSVEKQRDDEGSLVTSASKVGDNHHRTQDRIQKKI